MEEKQEGGGGKTERDRRSDTAITSSNVCLAGGSVKHPITDQK